MLDTKPKARRGELSTSKTNETEDTEGRVGDWQSCACFHSFNVIEKRRTRLEKL
jgi:hypothetical protein